MGSIPRWYCIRVLESVPKEGEKGGGISGLRKATDALCSKTECIMGGRDVFTEHIIGFAQL